MTCLCSCIPQTEYTRLDEKLRRREPLTEQEQAMWLALRRARDAGYPYSYPPKASPDELAKYHEALSRWRREREQQ